MVKATYQDTAFNKAVSDVPAHTPEFKTYVEQASAIMDELPGKFGATLAYHMDKLRLTNEALAGLAHLEKQGWNYLIRVRDKHRTVAYGAPLPDQPEFDIPLKLTLGRLTPRQLEAHGITVPESYYRIPPTMTFDYLELNTADFCEISFRVVRLQTDSGNTETIITNLDPNHFPLAVLKALYARRWGIETSFRSLKYAVGLIHLHAKKPDLVLQEIFASFLIFNFTQAIIWTVDTSQGQSKYKRHVNFSNAVFACCAFLRRSAPHPPAKAASHPPWPHRSKAKNHR